MVSSEPSRWATRDCFADAEFGTTANVWAALVHYEPNAEAVGKQGSRSSQVEE
jgi:hypothetical protein